MQDALRMEFSATPTHQEEGEQSMQARVLLAAVASAAAMGFLAEPALADDAADGLARAKEALMKYTSTPQFVAPGEAFDAKKCAVGKKMMSIPNNSANPFLKGIIDREKAAGAKVGLEVTEWENQGQPSQWIQGVELAIRDKYDIIDLISGIDPGTIAPQLEAAKAAGVKVMTSHFYDPSFEQHPVVSSSLTIGFGEIGTILANWAAVATEGKANIAIIVSNEVPPTIPLVANFKKELAANCPQCQIKQEINVGVTEWGTKIQPAVRFDVAIRGPRPAADRQGRSGQGRHLQRYAVRARLHPAGRGRHGHRREPRLDRLRYRRRAPARRVRTEEPDRAQRSLLHLRQEQRGNGGHAGAVRHRLR
jgi:ABC-type sugar transport system substrate-binding protein